MFLVGVRVKTHMNIRLAHVLVDWLYFTSHGHGDVKLIMWVHVRRNTELIQHEMMTSHYTICTLCPNLRSSYVLKMWTDLLRSHQTLHRNWVVIKVAFRSVKKRTMRHSRSRWDLPLSTRERYLWAPRVIRIRQCMAMLGLRVNQGSESQDRERVVCFKLDHISWCKGNSMHKIMTARQIWFARA